MIYLHKIIPLFVSPLGLVFLLIFLGIILNNRSFHIVALLGLFVFSLPIISSQLTRYLEGQYIPVPIDQVPEGDTVVVLSGMVRTIEHGSSIFYEFGEAVDRIFAGVALLNAERAKRLILTRGQMPWSVGIPEGEYLADFIVNYGIERSRVLLTPVVQNTEEEARAIAEMVNSNERIILVSSAFHMPRAEAVFAAYGVQVTPYAVDFRASASSITWIDFIPNVSALEQTSVFVREMIGRLYYKVKY